MGPGSNNKKLYMINPETGERFTADCIQDLEDSVAAADGVQKLTQHFSGPTISMEIRLPKHLRCPTRKRFIKLLMSHGVPRDIAIWHAAIVRHYGLTYQEAWYSAVFDLLCGRSLLE